MNKIHILNVSGGHGHFIQWLLDKVCTSTPDIDTVPYSELGASHNIYKQSGKFVFVDDPETKAFLETSQDKNAIMITIDDEILYWERSCIYRAGQAGTNLFDEKSIEDFLTKNGSPFPEFCKTKNITIKDGYRYAFQDLENSGARLKDNERKNYPGVKNNNVYFLSLSSFLNKEKLKTSLVEIANFFKFQITLQDLDEIYKVWYSKNTILQTNDVVKQYNNNKTVKLDVLQQAYVDAQQY